MPHSPAQRGRWADAAPSGSPPRKPPPESAVSPPAPTPSHRATGRPDLVYRPPALRGSPFSPLLPALRRRAHVPSAGSACSPRWGAHSVPWGRAPGKASVREVAGVELGGPSPDWGDSKAGLLPGPHCSPAGLRGSGRREGLGPSRCDRRVQFPLAASLGIPSSVSASACLLLCLLPARPLSSFRYLVLCSALGAGEPEPKRKEFLG